MSRASSPNGTAPNVWAAAGDDFSHSEMAANWDALDEAQVPLGGVIMWWRASVGRPAVPWSTGSVWQPCDGRTILNANHDMGGGDLVLPDLRGFVGIGAMTTDAGGYPGDANAGTANSDTAANAPGVRGVQGTNAKSTLPDHFHTHSHSHRVGNIAGVETLHAITADGSGAGLNDSPSNSPPYIVTDAAGSGHNVTLQGHAHQLAALYTSNARDPASGQIRAVDVSGADGSGVVRTMTSLQILGANPRAVGQSTNAHTTESVTDTPAASSTRGDGGGGASSPGDSLKVPVQQHSYGMVWLMKVRVTPR